MSAFRRWPKSNKGFCAKGDGKRRRDLQRWFDEDLPARFAGRILAFDARFASCWAHLTASLLDVGRPLPTLDSQIAATALAHDLVLVTRPIPHVKRTPFVDGLKGGVYLFKLSIEVCTNLNQPMGELFPHRLLCEWPARHF